jgi:hypothetical protein
MSHRDSDLSKGRKQKAKLIKLSNKLFCVLTNVIEITYCWRYSIQSILTRRESLSRQLRS